MVVAAVDADNGADTGVGSQWAVGSSSAMASKKPVDNGKGRVANMSDGCDG